MLTAFTMLWKHICSLTDSWLFHQSLIVHKHNLRKYKMQLKWNLIFYFYCRQILFYSTVRYCRHSTLTCRGADTPLPSVGLWLSTKQGKGVWERQSGLLLWLMLVLAWFHNLQIVNKSHLTQSVQSVLFVCWSTEMCAHYPYPTAHTYVAYIWRAAQTSIS